MKNLTQFKLLFIFFAVIAFLDISYGGKCDSPSSTRGPCKRRLHRWTYSAKLNYCSFFVYGGCPDTENIFKTRGECYSACVRKSLEEKS